MKILCDKCKREFDGQDDDMDNLHEILCPNCIKDTLDEMDWPDIFANEL